MKSNDFSSSFYYKVIHLIDLDDKKGAINLIRKNIDTLKTSDEVALAYLNCAFLNDKLGDYESAIDDFSESISIEAELEIINQRSKDIAFNGRSNSKYKNDNYKGAIDDKRNAKKIRLAEIDRFPMLNNFRIDYKNILLGTFIGIELEPGYNTLIKASEIKKSRYDLIADYKKVISNKRKEEVMKKLEFLSENKYESGDYKGSIKAIRRSEKYY